MNFSDSHNKIFNEEELLKEIHLENFHRKNNLIFSTVICSILTILFANAGLKPIAISVIIAYFVFSILNFIGVIRVCKQHELWRSLMEIKVVVSAVLDEEHLANIEKEFEKFCESVELKETINLKDKWDIYFNSFCKSIKVKKCIPDKLEKSQYLALKKQLSIDTVFQTKRNKKYFKKFFYH